MQNPGWKTTLTAMGAAATLAMGTAGPAGATDAEPTSDPVLVAQRTAAAAEARGPDYQHPADVQVGMIVPSDGTRMKDLYYLWARQTDGGYVELSARDNPALDKPGIATTTVHIYGNAAAFRSGAGAVRLTSLFTCTGAGVGGLTVGASGVSVSGGPSSSTLTWTSSRTNSSEVRQWYSDGGSFRCKASNLTAAKTTHRGVATATYKASDVRAEDAYSFTW